MTDNVTLAVARAKRAHSSAVDAYGVYRAALDAVGTDAARLCQSIGVDEEGMSRRVQQLDDEVARTLAQLTQQATTYRSSLHQLRANFHLDP